MRSKIKLLLTRRPGVSDAELDTRLKAEADRLRAAMPLSFCMGYAIEDPELYAIAAGEFAEADRPFDALMEIVAEGPEGTIVPPALLAGLGTRLADIVDPAASAALAGSEHVILPGVGPVLVLIANRRLPKFTHDGFLQYWLDYHGPFARENTPPEVPLYYRQFHADAAATAALLEATGFAIGDFDGAAECYYPGAEPIRALMGITEVVDKATIDERDFVDHHRCVTSLLQITTDSRSHIIA